MCATSPETIVIDLYNHSCSPESRSMIRSIAQEMTENELYTELKRLVDEGSIDPLINEDEMRSMRQIISIQLGRQ